MSGEQRSGTGLLLLLALPAIIGTIYLFFGIVRVSSPPGSAAFALLALPIVVAVYFATDRLWTRGAIAGTITRTIVIAV
ncbi:MAG TPA: hypothetical protein VKU62_13885, partial [Thermoanaerobaculia bacterium]|nr:hypothetical protein [Thermoanaerobaculia bacterium]